MTDKLPKVSILIPTYNRRKFTTLIIYNLNNLHYPRELLEVVIYDDHPSEPHFIDKDEVYKFEKCINIKVKYIYNPSRHLSIGEKRNKLVKNASHNLLFHLDTDDLYLPTALIYSLKEMEENKWSLTGSSQMLFLYPEKNFETSGIKCDQKRLIHEATMLYTRKHWKSMGGFSKTSSNEGCRMIEGIESKVGDLDITKLMICVCHGSNTISKDHFHKVSESIGEVSDDIKYLLSNILDLKFEKN